MLNVCAEKSYEIEYCSPTGLDCFSRCPARYFFSKLERLVSPMKSRMALDFGGCLHCCFHAAYTDPAKAIEIFKLKAEEEKVVWDDKRNPTVASTLLHAFHEFHQAHHPYKPLDPPVGVIDCEDKHSDYECPFLLDVGGNYPLYGKIDRPVLYQGKTWPLDYKTAAWVQANYFENFTNDLQTLAYTLAMSYLSKEQCSGMILELIKVHATKPEISFQPLFVSQQWLETFVAFVKWKMEEIRIFNESKQWPKNPAMCAPYGSFGVQGWLCEYSPLCAASDWKQAARFFMKEEWSPLKTTKDKNVLKASV